MQVHDGAETASPHGTTPEKDYPMSLNLYAVPDDGAEFQSWCGGNIGGSNESCVEVAELPGGGFAVQDSKPEGSGRQLRFTADELDAFAVGWIAQRGLTA
jgi:hypothetical protein